jgi:hypothetical protein
MAKLMCVCGHLNRLSGEGENEFFILNYPLQDDLQERLDNNTLNADDMNTILVDQAPQGVRCEKCARLYVYEDTENEERTVKRYALEDISIY